MNQDFFKLRKLGKKTRKNIQCPCPSPHSPHTPLPTSVSVALDPLSSDPLRKRDRLKRTGTSTGLPNSNSISSLGTRCGERSGSSSVLVSLPRSSSLHSLTSDTAEHDEMVLLRRRNEPMSMESPWNDGLTHISVPRTIVVAFCCRTEVILWNILFMAPRIKMIVILNLRWSGFVETYIGESKWPLGVRFKEHLNLDKPTGVGEHCLATGHSLSTNNIKVLCREQEWHRRKVKEAIYIKQQGPTMNRNQGYQLPLHPDPSAGIWVKSLTTYA